MPTKSRGPLTPKSPTRIPPSSSLDTHETTGIGRMPWRVPGEVPPPAPSDFQDGCTGAAIAIRRATRREIAFRHGRWADRRKEVARALKVAGVPLARQERFHQCGASCSMLVNWQTGERKLVGSYCRDRFCQPCGAARGINIGNNLARLMDGCRCRFVTLTRRSFGLDLRTTLDRLTDSFSRLRKTPFFRRHFKGGAAMIEVKRGKRSGDWHCHYHLIVVGDYLDQRELSNVWQTITGDSYICDIRRVDDNRKAAAYVAKYVSKPLDPSCFIQDLDLVECILALHGRRLCNTFGKWRGVELEERADDGEGWIEVGPLDAILRLAEQRDQMARGYTLLLRKEGWGEGGRADPPGQTGS